MTSRTRTRWLSGVPVVAAAVLVAGCGSGPRPAEPAPAPAAPTAGTGARAGGAEGVLAPPEQGGNAVTYDPALAPQGAEMSVDVSAAGGGTQVRLEVEGLLPDRGYAAHAHTGACGPTGDAAGPHFQDRVDPAAGPGKPSTDPAYANPRNEIWLDLRTDAEGDGEAVAEVPFAFADRAPASVVLHEAEATATEPGRAGGAGARLACLTVPFR
jgi:superoxide dismutase, Cu-Zn family